MFMRLRLRWLLAALVLVGWLGVGSAHAVGPVLYSARWSGGLSGWQPVGDSGWTVTNGIPLYGNHTGAADLIAPYRVDGLQNFAVEASIARIGDRGKSLAYPERGYGVFVRGTGKQGADVGGGFFFGEANGNGFYPQSGLDWHGSVLRGADVALHDGFNTFRLEVHGDHYALFENGVLTVQATAKGFRGDRVGVFTREYRIRVRSFLVFALPAQAASGGPAPALLGSLPALDLHAKEAPSGFRKSYGEYYTNAEVATGRGVTADSLSQTGRLLTYEVVYRQLLDRRNPDKGEKAIDVSVTAFRSTDAAAANYDYIRGYYQDHGFRLSTPGKYGSEDFLTSYDDTFRQQPYSNYDLDFVRGTHFVAVSVYFVEGTVPAFQALQWLDNAARAIDRRLAGVRYQVSGVRASL
jgi:hypothetical protein